ncbi:unnamed protein product [Strongylus vulgaris]|uniref:Uncharacterized protein n=1 Tax=Strongylus vulgaris TaxID=40348 RepID=A0A3P7M3Z4_STRVU|nr:unnamed protein product [Strongylus vulgaris]
MGKVISSLSIALNVNGMLSNYLALHITIC